MLETILNHLSPKVLLIGLAVLYVVRNIVNHIFTERRIYALGGHAPKIRTYIPGGKSKSKLQFLGDLSDSDRL